MTRHAALKRVVGVAGLLSLAGCLSPTGSCTPARSLQGRWRYEATQSTPVPATLSGTLDIRTQACTDFQGALDVLETSVAGQRRLGGPVTGSVVGSGEVTFELTFADGDRVHLVHFDGDSLRGTWVEVTSGESATGTVVARPEAQP